MSNKKPMTVDFPAGLKKELERMSKETDISQRRLIALAAFSLVANYNKHGYGIFEGLISVANKQKENGED